MSWSFSVTEKSPGDARRVFENKVAENQAQMPNHVENGLLGAMRRLSESAQPNQRTTIASSGHFNKDGSGNCDIRILIAVPTELPPPNVEYTQGTNEVAAAEGPFDPPRPLGHHPYG